MRKLTYFAVFEADGKGGYGVYFPDLMGCTSFGANFEAALEKAKEALGIHLYEMEKDNDEISPPTTDPGKLAIDPETSGSYVLFAVTIFPDMVKDRLDNRAVKTNTTLPAWLKEMAEEQGVNFSQILQTSLKEHLGLSR